MSYQRYAGHPSRRGSLGDADHLQHIENSLDRIHPGPGEVIVGTADGPVAKPVTAIGGGAIGPRVVALGDSITQGDSGNTYDKGYMSATSWFTWALYHAPGRLTFVRNAGIWGNTLQQMRDRLDTDVLAYDPDVVLFLGGTNNLATTTVQGMIDLYTGVVNRLREAGITVIPITLAPRSGDATVQRRLHDFNQWLRSWGVQEGMRVLDGTSSLMDPATGQAKASLFQADLLHPNQNGSYEQGKSIASQLATIFPNVVGPLRTFPNDPTNLITNGAFMGDSNADGLADNWALEGSTGTVTTTLTPDADGSGNVQELNYTAAGNKAVTRLITSGWQAGDIAWFSGTVEAENVGGGGNVRVQLSLPGHDPDKLSPLYLVTVPSFGPVTFNVPVKMPGTSPGVIVHIRNSGTGIVRVSQFALRNQSAIERRRAQ